MLNSFENLTGQTINQQYVLKLVRRKPQIAYEVRCTRCGTIQICSHINLRYGNVGCPISQCGQPQAVSHRDINSSTSTRGSTYANSASSVRFNQTTQEFNNVTRTSQIELLKRYIEQKDLYKKGLAEHPGSWDTFISA